MVQHGIFQLTKRFDLKNFGIIVSLCIILINYFDYRSFKYYRLQELKNDDRNFKLKYNNLQIFNETSMIFICGSPRSGLTLLSSFLDSRFSSSLHSSSTMLMLDFLYLNSHHVIKNGSETKRLEQAQIYSDTVNIAAKNFISSLISNYKLKSKFLILKHYAYGFYIEYLSILFPKSKFILMIRDGRSVIVSNLKNVSSILDKNYEQHLLKWNELNEIMYSQCMLVSTHCLPIYYEQLVIQPKIEIKKISRFLDLSLNDSINLLNNKQINRSKINTDWINVIPKRDLNEIENIAPILKRLGYETKNYSQNYNKNFDKYTIINQAEKLYWTQIDSYYLKISMMYRLFYRKELK